MAVNCKIMAKKNWISLKQDEPVCHHPLDLKFSDGREEKGFKSIWGGFRRLTEDHEMIELEGVTYWMYSNITEE